MAITIKADAQHKHVYWMDLEQNGTLVACVILKKDETSIAFIEIDELDVIDKNRIFKLINGRDSDKYECWDLFSVQTLGNGVNALEYFHQLVKVITPSGQIMSPTNVRVGLVPPTAEAAPVLANTGDVTVEQLEAAKAIMAAANVQSAPVVAPIAPTQPVAPVVDTEAPYGRKLDGTPKKRPGKKK
jgi:hypothetical protein